MIVRNDGDSLLLITQPDHARLSAEIVASLRREPAAAGPHRAAILLAAREHDNGWAELDGAPTIDPDSGWPQDFLGGSAAVKLELWLRGIRRAARMDLHAGALVAEHALTVHGSRSADRAWDPFFESVSALRDDLLEQSGLGAPASGGAFDAAYRCVRLGDAFSLQFCNGWPGPERTLDYHAVVDGSTLVISPDPFGGAVVTLRVIGRRIPARRYRDDGDLRSALAAAGAVVVEGEARGPLIASD